MRALGYDLEVYSGTLVPAPLSHAVSPRGSRWDSRKARRLGTCLTCLTCLTYFKNSEQRKRQIKNGGWGCGGWEQNGRIGGRHMGAENWQTPLLLRQVGQVQ